VQSDFSQFPSKFQLVAIRDDTVVSEEFCAHVQLRSHQVYMLGMVKICLEFQPTQPLGSLYSMERFAVPARIESFPFYMPPLVRKKSTARCEGIVHNDK